MTLVIFLLVLLAIVVGLMVLIIKKVKSVGLKIVLSIGVVVASIIVGVIGTGIIGFVSIGNSIQSAVEEKKKEDKTVAESRIPMISSTGEKKEIFNKNDVVKGNGIEISILKTSEITDYQELQYTEKKVLCAIEFKIKNLYKDRQTITSFDFDMQQADGTIIYPSYTSDKALAEYTFQSVELQVNGEATKKISFDCKSAKKPTTFLYKGGEYLNFSFFNDEEKKYTPIRYNLEF
jgi:hypothetical protein